MKGVLNFDPAHCEYGPATLSIRRILTEWANVDWFVPPHDEALARTRAVRFFEEHNFLARMRMPDLFPDRLDIRVATGTWVDFHDLCLRVRQPQSSWDWKFCALKKLSSAHSKEHGWTLSEAVRWMAPDGTSRPGDLFLRIGDQAVWGGTLGPQLNLKETVPPHHAEDAGFYLSYANMDAIECIEWQLAERTNGLESNPFLPLTRCYGEGLYPFSLGPAEVVLFAFDR